MSGTTLKAPKVPIDQFKQTKIIATVGPSTNTYDSIVALIQAGANGLRLNFSHGTEDERKQQIVWIRKASKQLSKPVAIIQDLQGPKIRLGDFDDEIRIEAGQHFKLEYNGDFERSNSIPTQYDLSKKVKRGERLYIFDGKLKTQVTSVKDGVVHVEAANSGVCLKRKGINLPDTDFGGDIITPKDKRDIVFGSENDVDYVALSFVQTAEDIINLQRMLKNLGSKARIIAKIETKAAVENIEEIIRAADAVMVARGDLAIETSAESVPIVQRQIIGFGKKYAKPTIVATQMLATMTDSPEPTRAEVSDVATAVLIGTDCIMLSDETASGDYPVESVEMMKRVATYTEHNRPLQVSFPEYEASSTKQNAICNTVITLADQINATAIVAETKSGATALQLAARRPERSIFAVTSTDRVAQQLAIVFGIKSFVRPDDKLAATKLTNWLQRNKVLHNGDMIVTATGQYPGVVGTTDTIKVRIIS